MSSKAEFFLDIICPTLGGIIAISMFAAPIKALQKAIDRGSLQELNPIPWIFMTGNCIGWVGYSYLKHDIFIFLANGPGILISLWLNFGAAKLRYMEDFIALRQTSESNKCNDSSSGIPKMDAEDIEDSYGVVLQRSTSIFNMSHEIKVMLILFIWIKIFTIITFFDVSSERKIFVVGIIVNVNLVVFFGAPLSSIKIVVKRRNSTSIHLGTMILNILNTTFWLIYGLSKKDPYICIPNGLGLLLGIIQMILCIIYPRLPSVEFQLRDQDDENEFEVDRVGNIDMGGLLGESDSKHSIKMV